MMVNSHQRRKMGQSGVRKWRKVGFPRVIRGGGGRTQERSLIAEQDNITIRKL